MKKSLLLLAVCVWPVAADIRAQENAAVPVVVEMREFYKEEGYIFPASFTLPAPFNMVTRFTPAPEDVKAAEKVFLKEYHHLVNDNTDPKEYYSKFVRQYAGYIAANGEHKILIQLINNRKAHKTKEILGKDWKSSFVSVSNDDMTSVVTFFVANIDAGRLSSEL